MMRSLTNGHPPALLITHCFWVTLAGSQLRLLKDKVKDLDLSLLQQPSLPCVYARAALAIVILALDRCFLKLLSLLRWPLLVFA